MIQRLLFQIAEYKWLIAVYALFALVFCLYVYLKTKHFAWEKKKVTSFAILFDLDSRSRTSFAIAFGRVALIFYYALALDCDDIYDLAIIEIITIAIIIFSGNLKAIFQIFSYLAIFVLLYLESMFFDYYFDMGKDTTILLMAILIALFAFLYSILQFFIFWEQLLKKSFERDMKKYQKGRS